MTTLNNKEIELLKTAIKDNTLTKRQAKKLSIIKIEGIIEYDCISPQVHKYPILRLLTFNCGYCEKYRNSKGKTLHICDKCPIRPKIKDYNDLEEAGCIQNCHPFINRDWIKLLKLIKES